MTAAGSPGHDLASYVPQGRPDTWPVQLIDGVVAWAFLADVAAHQSVRPWLVLANYPSAMGPVAFAVPRWAPEADWPDADAYRQWEEAAWTTEYVPLASTVTVAEAATGLAPSPTRPRWANRERLVDIAIRADLQGHSSAQIVKDDGEAALASDRARSVRKELASARAFLAAIGALPWAAFTAPAMSARTPWWKDARFADALARWRHDATNLSWRAAREAGDLDLPRRAAATVRQQAWGVGTSKIVLAHARGVLLSSARDFDGPEQAWLELVIGFPGQTPECHADLVARADVDGSARELRELWHQANTTTNAAHETLPFASRPTRGGANAE